ncbi:hypothetical protein LOZ52_005164 [Ophidiomyces ophidiicola]|nr:hypothetical protein LOZ64_005040 [Ophidiomyces ophidiicola]KAI2002399.1 hypothetical protein LOZ50_005006 [Ophidiomyces ophidiicola]KAI2010237.1 hypothetical protein LOZ49_003548 [Ophidiomyces ophidiicola]KAI2013960.1 hypothetical protein LOZ46_005665 [Ophidiomyces ophidiicola]KAI2132838.1 hypothetical protein LOZ29_004987 [Ophidiomyces ophidiicola]
MKPSDAFQNLSSHVATVNVYIMKVLKAGGVDVSEENENDLGEVDLCREDAVERSGSDQILCVGISI